MKRYNYLFDDSIHDYDMIEDENGDLIDIKDCIIAQQDNMMLGDSLDNLNDKIQKQVNSDDIFDVMIIMEKKK